MVDWARSHTISALWSCLAAHGAVLRLDGVTRRRAAEKISGVFACEVAANDWATRGAASSILVPHSRCNGLSRSDLVERGYHISSWSGDVEVDCFWRREPSLFLFAQGHPEYNADTLAREFRRDALRFLNGESNCFPSPPRNYFSSETQAALDALKQSANSLGRPRLARMLGEIVESDAPSPAWADDAERLYRNWLELVAFEKMREAASRRYRVSSSTSAATRSMERKFAGMSFDPGIVRSNSASTANIKFTMSIEVNPSSSRFRSGRISPFGAPPLRKLRTMASMRAEISGV